jgi:hypothetical protein
MTGCSDSYAKDSAHLRTIASADAQLHPFQSQLVDDVARIAEGPCQAVELGNDERVVRATRGKRDPQSRAFSIGASQTVIRIDLTGVDSKLRKS